MNSSRNLFLFASLSLFLSLRPARAADDLQRVLHQLDVVAANFHTTSADFEFDSVMTDPIPDTQVQKGTVYYQRKGKSFQMAAHIAEQNGKADPLMYSFADGKLRLFNPKIDQVQTIDKASAYEGYLMLGFGASGKELSEKWNITDAGEEVVGGVKTEKLELVAKDATVRKNLPKVTVWLDTSRGVSVKQVLDEGQGQSRTAIYSNIKVNESLPSDVFTIKTDSKTQYVEH
jgi:outer membrane lipoprotein-sorting protein